VKVKNFDRLEELKRLNNMKTEVNKAIEAHSTLWTLTNDEEYQTRLHSVNNEHRKKLKDIEVEMNKFS
jgi:hypothetical protein